MDAANFPHEFMVILNPQNKTGTALSLHLWWKKPVLYLYSVISCMAPFSSCFRNPGMFNILSLKAKIMLVKPITFQSCILKKIKRLIQRTSIVHFVGDFPLKIIRNFKKYYFLTGIQLEIIIKKNLSTSKHWLKLVRIMFLSCSIHLGFSVAYTRWGYNSKCKNKTFQPIRTRLLLGSLILDLNTPAPFLIPCFKMECKNYTINNLSG